MLVVHALSIALTLPFDSIGLARQNFNMQKLFKSFVDAWHGIRAGWSQRSVHIHMFIAFAVFVAGYFLQISRIEWFVVIVLVGVVWSAELFNTAIEDEANIMRDKLGAPYSVMGRAKDLAAGAVLIVAVTAAIIGLAIFLPKIAALIF